MQETTAEERLSSAEVLEKYDNGNYTYGDSDVISFHIYASWFSPAAILWVKLLEINACYSDVT